MPQGVKWGLRQLEVPMFSGCKQEMPEGKSGAWYMLEIKNRLDV